MLRSKQGLTGQCPIDFAVWPRNKNVYSTVPKGHSFYLRPETKLFVSEMSQGRISFAGYLLKTWEHGDHNSVSKHQALKIFLWEHEKNFEFTVPAFSGFVTRVDSQGLFLGQRKALQQYCSDVSNC